MLRTLVRVVYSRYPFPAEYSLNECGNNFCYLDTVDMPFVYIFWKRTNEGLRLYMYEDSWIIDQLTVHAMLTGWRRSIIYTLDDNVTAERYENSFTLTLGRGSCIKWLVYICILFRMQWANYNSWYVYEVR